MQERIGRKLSLQEGIYGLKREHNGILQILYGNYMAIGYSAIKKNDGSENESIKFGDGAFYNVNENNNVIYKGAPTVPGACPIFAGIMAFEQGIADSEPAANNRIKPYNFGLLVTQGRINYSVGNICWEAGELEENVSLYGRVYKGFSVFCSASDGRVYFSTKDTVYVSANDVKIGSVVAVNPNDNSISIYISPSYIGNVADIAGATPTITVGTPTATELPTTITSDVGGMMKLMYKVSTDTDYTEIEGEFKPVWNDTQSKFVVSYTFTGLTTGTTYTLRADLYSANGRNSGTANGTTA